jgi:hypothetical protein
MHAQTGSQAFGNCQRFAAFDFANGKKVALLASAR